MPRAGRRDVAGLRREGRRKARPLRQLRLARPGGRRDSRRGRRCSSAACRSPRRSVSTLSAISRERRLRRKPRQRRHASSCARRSCRADRRRCVRVSSQSMTSSRASSARSSPWLAASARMATRCCVSSATVVSQSRHRWNIASFSAGVRVGSGVAGLRPAARRNRPRAMIRSSASHQSSEVRSVKPGQTKIVKGTRVLPEHRQGVLEIVAIAVVERDGDAARFGRSSASPTSSSTETKRQPRSMKWPRKRSRKSGVIESSAFGSKLVAAPAARDAASRQSRPRPAPRGSQRGARVKRKRFERSADQSVAVHRDRRARRRLRPRRFLPPPRSKSL